MNYFRILILFTISLISFNSSGQKIVVGFESGYRWYHMNYLKEFTKEIPFHIPFQTKILSNHPPYWNYGGVLGYTDPSGYGYGFRYNFASTGAKISRSDYSGEYKYESVIYRNLAGMYVNIPLHQPAKFMTHFTFDAGYIWTNLEMSEMFVLYDISETSTTHTFNSNGLQVTPSLIFSYAITPFCIGARTGYELNIFPRKFSGATLSQPTLKGEEPKPNWSGAFINLYVTFQIIDLHKLK